MRAQEQIRQADAITAEAHLNDARIVCGIHSRKLSLVERVGSDPKIAVFVISDLNTSIREYNQEAGLN